MVKLIEIMLKENLIKKDDIFALIRSRPPKKVSFENLLSEKMIDLDTFEIFLLEKIRLGVITLEYLDGIEGIDTTAIIKELTHTLEVKHNDLNETEMDMKFLEEKLLKHQRKKRKIWYLFFILFIVVLLSIWLLMNNSDGKFNIFKKNIANTHKASDKDIFISKKYNALLNNSLTRLEILELRTSESKNNNDSIDTKMTDTLVDIPILDLNGKYINEKNDYVRHKDNVHLDIVETTGTSAYEDVEKRFQQSNNIDDALFLAKTYYKKGNYKKAEKWAFETNQLDPTLEESFLIFVKSKMKLGQKNEVIAILNQYLNHKNSQDARILLEQIKNEKF